MNNSSSHRRPLADAAPNLRCSFRSPPTQACCKHFVANELDGWNGTDRNHIDVFVPQQDLVDSYLPSFQTCVEEGKASGIMCSCACRGVSPTAFG